MVSANADSQTHAESKPTQTNALALDRAINPFEMFGLILAASRSNCQCPSCRGLRRIADKLVEATTPKPEQTEGG